MLPFNTKKMVEGGDFKKVSLNKREYIWYINAVVDSLMLSVS